MCILFLTLTFNSCKSAVKSKNIIIPPFQYTEIKSVNVRVVQVIKSFEKLNKKFNKMVSEHYKVVAEGEGNDSEIIFFIHPLRYVSGKILQKANEVCGETEYRFYTGFTIQVMLKDVVVYEKDGESVYAEKTCLDREIFLKGGVKERILEKLLLHEHVMNLFVHEKD